MGDDLLRRLLGEQRKRLVASLLGYVEQSAWWASLTAAEQRTLRDRVLVSIGVYHDFVLDVVKVGSEDSLRNEEALRLIQQVHASQSRLEQRMRRP